MFLTGFGYTFIKFKLISWIESSPLLTAFGLPFSFIQFQLSGNELSKSGVINSKVFPVPSAHVGQSEICVSQRAKTFNPTRVSPYSPDASRSPFPSIISHETSEDQSPSVQTNSIISPWVASNVKLAEKIEKKNQIKFLEGLISGLDLRQAQIQLYSIQNQLLQSMLEVINKKTNLDIILTQN